MAFVNDSVVLNNATNVPTNGVVSAKHKLEQIEAYIIVTTILIVFLVVFGSCRRRSHSVFLKILTWIAYNLPTYLKTYSFGQMQTASFENELFGIWAIFLLNFFGNADCISAYSLEDNENRRRFSMIVLVKYYGLPWLLGTSSPKRKFTIPLYLLCVFALLRTSLRSQALGLASRTDGLVRNTNLIADFMANEHTLSNEDEVNPTCMKGYKYWVKGIEEEKMEATPPLYQYHLKTANEVVTIDMIWQCQGSLLSSAGDSDGRLKDICLSCALFSLLCRRFAGYSMSESSQLKTWNFVRHGLLAEAGDPVRAFRVIEVELAFLYDFFYTNYYALFTSGFLSYKIQQLSIVIIGCVIVTPILKHYHTPNGYLNLLTVSGRDVDVRVTAIVIVAILFMEVVQFLVVNFSDWAKGNRVLLDFDIRKEANESFKAIEQQFLVPVSENYLEIHFFWAGKGTCCIPSQGAYGPSISAISAINNNPILVPNTTTEFIPSPRSSNGNLIGLIVGISIGVGGILSVFIVFYIIHKRKRLQTNDDEELLGIDVRPFTFSYAELHTATEEFNPANKLGEGGFGPVYKGTLIDGRVVAVKQLSAASHQGKNQFVTEIAIISAVQHRNLVKLYGCCVEANKRLLVYEYLENKSLDQALFGERSLNLSWSARFNICLGVARGLAYLHEESRLRIVHRDVKAGNILLDSDLIPKISDFGLAKLYDDNKSHISTGLAGTIGYLAPEYAMRGHLTEKTDVFAFGIVALEMVSGRRNSDSSLEEGKTYLLEWAWQLHENNREVDLVDARLSEFNEEEVKQVIGVSFLCTQSSPTLRPSMSRVVAMLLGDIEISTVTSKPGYLTDWKSNDPTSLRNDVAARGTVSIYYDYSGSSSMVGYVDNSPDSTSKPMLGKAIKEGR